MVSGLLSQTIEIAIGTLNLKKGVIAKTANICIGMGIKPQKRPIKTPTEIDFLLIERYSLGILYFLIKASSLTLEPFFLNNCLIMKVSHSFNLLYCKINFIIVYLKV